MNQTLCTATHCEKLLPLSAFALKALACVGGPFARLRSWHPIWLAPALLAFHWATPAQAESVSISESLADERRALVVTALIRADGTAEHVETVVSAGPPRGYAGDPAQISIEWFDINGNLLGIRNSWDPRVEFSRDADGNEVMDMLPEAAGPFAIPFNPTTINVRFKDAATTKSLLTVNVATVVENFCDANPDDPNCDGRALNRPPVADAGPPYRVTEGESLRLDGSDSFDPDGNALIFRWDLDNDDNFGETGTAATRGDEVGFNPIFIAQGLTAPTTVTVTLEVCDGQPLCDTDTAEIAIEEEVIEIGPGDFDRDGDVDWLDVGQYLGVEHRNRPANPDDPYDLNGDGVVNILDARVAIFLCDLPGCTIINP